jgi:hypothetical protein
MMSGQTIGDKLLNQWKNVPPKYNILETVYDRINKQTWHKLSANRTMKVLIMQTPGKGTNWDLGLENNGAKYYWVTDKTLTLLQLQSANELR